MIKSEQLWTVILGGALTLISKIDVVTNALTKVSPQFAEEFPLYVLAIVGAMITKDSVKGMATKIKNKKK